MNPPEFQVGLDLVKVHEWLSYLERVFLIVHYSEENKVIFVSLFKMVGECFDPYDQSGST